MRAKQIRKKSAKQVRNKIAKEKREMTAGLGKIAKKSAKQKCETAKQTAKQNRPRHRRLGRFLLLCDKEQHFVLKFFIDVCGFSGGAFDKDCRGHPRGGGGAFDPAPFVRKEQDRNCDFFHLLLSCFKRFEVVVGAEFLPSDRRLFNHFVHCY